jgi:hypothetical protein
MWHILCLFGFLLLPHKDTLPLFCKDFVYLTCSTNSLLAQIGLDLTTFLSQPPEIIQYLTFFFFFQYWGLNSGSTS